MSQENIQSEIYKLRFELICDDKHVNGWDVFEGGKELRVNLETWSLISKRVSILMQNVKGPIKRLPGQCYFIFKDDQYTFVFAICNSDGIDDYKKFNIPLLLL